MLGHLKYFPQYHNFNSLHDVYYIFTLQNKVENRRKLDQSQSNIALLYIIYNVNELYLMSRPDQMLTACLKQEQPLQLSSNKHLQLHTKNSSYNVQHSSTSVKSTKYKISCSNRISYFLDLLNILPINVYRRALVMIRSFLYFSF